MLKRDTRRHAAKAMLKHSGCYSNTLTLHMYAEDIKLYWLRNVTTADFPGMGKNSIATPESGCDL